jgi:hypothetical protein
MQSFPCLFLLNPGRTRSRGAWHGPGAPDRGESRQDPSYHQHLESPPHDDRQPSIKCCEKTADRTVYNVWQLSSQVQLIISINTQTSKASLPIITTKAQQQPQSSTHNHLQPPTNNPHILQNASHRQVRRCPQVSTKTPPKTPHTPTNKKLQGRPRPLDHWQCHHRRLLRPLPAQDPVSHL